MRKIERKRFTNSIFAFFHYKFFTVTLQDCLCTKLHGLLSVEYSHDTLQPVEVVVWWCGGVVWYRGDEGDGGISSKKRRWIKVDRKF